MWMRYKSSVKLLCALFLWIIEGGLSSPNNPNIAEETQHAVCNISTKDIQTSANASITRQLRGVCTSRQLDLRFQELELKIIQELKIIKRVLNVQMDNESPRLIVPKSSVTVDYEEYSDDLERNTRMRNKNIENDDGIDEMKPVISSFRSTKIKGNDRNNLDDILPVFITDEQTQKISNVNIEEKIDSSILPAPENITIDNYFMFRDALMNEETLMQLNDTIQKTENETIFYYFWEVENFKILMSKFELYISSSPFLVMGHELFIQLYPNQPEHNYLTMKLRTSRSFQKQHTFSIHRKTSLGRNIRSRMLGSLSLGDRFVIPEKLIQESGCSTNNSILIELCIFLQRNN